MLKRAAIWELARYVFFGLLTTLVNFIVYFSCNAALGDEYYLASNVAAWVIAVAFAFVTNKLWVFDSKAWTRNVLPREIGTFVSARVFSLLAEEAGLYLMIDILAFDSWNAVILGYETGGDAVAKAIMQFVVIALNYVFSKLIIFRKKKGV